MSKKINSHLKICALKFMLLNLSFCIYAQRYLSNNDMKT